MQSTKDYNRDNLNYPPKCAFHLNQIILKCVAVFQKTPQICCNKNGKKKIGKKIWKFCKKKWMFHKPHLNQVGIYVCKREKNWTSMLQNFLMDVEFFLMLQNLLIFRICYYLLHIMV